MKSFQDYYNVHEGSFDGINQSNPPQQIMPDPNTVVQNVINVLVQNGFSASEVEYQKSSIEHIIQQMLSSRH